MLAIIFIEEFNNCVEKDKSLFWSGCNDALKVPIAESIKSNFSRRSKRIGSEGESPEGIWVAVLADFLLMKKKKSLI